ncbi:MAG: methyltransferase [Lachnospiraceae bacterium]|nr:methyltransferase [Lachnospiraceae bacterium]
MKFSVENINIDDDAFLLFKPENVLTDDEYDSIKQYMETMGGHWRERVHGFIFSKEHIKRSDYSEWQEINQFFPTPKNVAKRAVELSGIKEYSYNYKTWLLEPSAGHGDLLDVIHTYVSHTISEYVVEPVEENAEIIMRKGHLVEQKIFEDFYKEHKSDEKHITHVIMNPPFNRNRDIRHTMMAYDLLKEGGVLVSIISENALYYDNEFSRKFRDWLKKHNAYIEPIPYGSFKDSGTTVDTVIVKVVKEG